jgi:hypothetical protein
MPTCVGMTGSAAGESDSAAAGMTRLFSNVLYMRDNVGHQGQGTGIRVMQSGLHQAEQRVHNYDDQHRR